jgi:hypothetical protein
MPFRGALVYKFDASQTFANVTNSQLTFPTVEYDTDGFFNQATQRFVIPAGVSKVRLRAQAVWASNSSGMRQMVIKKNFVNGDLLTGWFPGVPANTLPANNATTTDVQTSTPVISVVEGDTFLAEAYQSSGGSLSVLKSVGTWFSIEVVE